MHRAYKGKKEGANNEENEKKKKYLNPNNTPDPLTHRILL